MDSPFDYPAEIVPFIEQVEEVDQEITDQNEIALGEIQMEVRDKMLGVGMWTKELTMRRDGLKELKKEVTARIGILENKMQRLKQWIWKQAKDMEFIKKDEKGEWSGKKIESNQITIGWRKSKGIKENPDHPAHSKIRENFPQLFHFKVKPLGKDGGIALYQLQTAGLIEIESCELSRSTVKQTLENSLPIAGLELENRINPQIKV